MMWLNIEAADSDSLTSASAVIPRGGRQIYTRKTAPVIKGLVAKRRNCGCGACATCVDKAKWERIFNEKFADPEYYKTRPLKQGSSLGWLRAPR